MAEKTTAKKTKEAKADDSFDAFSAFFMQPSFDSTGLVDFSRKNMEATAEIAKILSDGSKDVIQRQVDAVRDSAKDFVNVSQGAMTNQTADAGSAFGLEYFQTQMTKNLEIAREVADILVETNQKAVAVVQKRMTDGVAELQSSAQ